MLDGSVHELQFNFFFLTKPNKKHKHSYFELMISERSTYSCRLHTFTLKNQKKKAAALSRLIRFRFYTSNLWILITKSAAFIWNVQKKKYGLRFRYTFKKC